MISYFVIDIKNTTNEGSQHTTNIKGYSVKVLAKYD